MKKIRPLRLFAPRVARFGLYRLAGLACLAGIAASTGHAQLVRQAPNTPNLPAALPAATGYVLENALGSLTFSQPLAPLDGERRFFRVRVDER